ncbi:hypothetical protein ACGFYF_35435 [Streptomyces lavendulae]
MAGLEIPGADVAARCPVAARAAAPLLALGPWSPVWLVPWGAKGSLAVA